MIELHLGLDSASSTNPPEAPAPDLTALRAWPNPFRGRVELRLPGWGPGELSVFDVRGRRVRTLSLGPAEAQGNLAVWDGRSDGGADLPSGIYVIRLKRGERTFEERVARLR